MATVPSADPPAPFHPLVATWFRDANGEPTEIQRRACPEIAAGGHDLLVAPTGSGKTLAAFLWAVDRLPTGSWTPGGVRVVDVSPLPALGNDIQRNLLRPVLRQYRVRALLVHAARNGRQYRRSKPPVHLSAMVLPGG